MSQWVTGSHGSSNDAEAGSEAGVPVSQWVAGSLGSSNEAEAGGEAGVPVSQWVTGSLGSSNDAEAGSEVGVPVSQWVTGSLDGDSGKMKGRRSRGARISKISGAITRIHSAWIYSRIFVMRASSLVIFSTESGPLSAYKMKTQLFLSVTRRMCWH